MDTLALTELVPLPEAGRVFEQVFQAGFADCAPSGRIRLDALARWLQDVAYADVVDARLAEGAAWVVRRTRIRVRRFPRVGEPHTVATFCSGLGRMWAERRTSIRALDGDQRVDADSDGDGDRAGVEAVSLWVHLDPSSWRPVPLSAEEVSLYATSSAGRRVTARLRHPLPTGSPQASSWAFRETELDIAGHVNNAAYWTPLEEELLAGPEVERVDAELEYRSPCQSGEKLFLRDGSRRWIVGDGRETHASIVIAEADYRMPRS